jgi:hypothetical protein
MIAPFDVSSVDPFEVVQRSLTKVEIRMKAVASTHHPEEVPA